MQVGEPINVALPGDSPREVEFEAELVSITFKSAVDVSYQQVKVQPPHWEKAHAADLVDPWDLAERMKVPAVEYSKRPAAYLIEGAHQVEVTIKVTRSRNVSGDAAFVGTMGSREAKGTCPTAVGDHVVTATLSEGGEALDAFLGEMVCTLALSSPSMTLIVGKALVEVYFLFGTPIEAYMPGVWGEALRFLFGRVHVGGIADEKELAKTITRYCHGAHGLKYDVNRGASRHGVRHDGGDLRLGKYMLLEPAECNCHDQAGALQALCGAVGVRVSWQFLEPFGFINETDLVGWGRCNNPFFRDNTKRIIVPPDADDRTAFGNHAFVKTEDIKVLDACAGPHSGAETPKQYLDVSIDYLTPLYARRDHRPGTVADIAETVGLGEILWDRRRR
jgi:hypothetical protein